MQIGPYALSNNLVLAPMAGITDRPFRQLCKRLGAGYAVSERVRGAFHAYVVPYAVGALRYRPLIVLVIVFSENRDVPFAGRGEPVGEAADVFPGDFRDVECGKYGRSTYVRAAFPAEIAGYVVECEGMRLPDAVIDVYRGVEVGIPGFAVLV